MYDPVIAKQIPNEQHYPNSYWADTVEHIPSFTQLEQELTVDTAIIGAGYAGLSCGYHLAKHYNNNAIILEANGIGWGCSGRNAGFVLPLSGRLGYQALVKRFGLETTKHIHHEFLAGVELVEDLIERSGKDVERQPQGYLKIAHGPKYFDQLKRNADYMQQNFGYQVTPLTQQALKQQYVDHHQAYGALRYHQGYGIHPFKLCIAYAELATQAGAQIFTHSPVNQTEFDGQYHHLLTPKGKVKAKNLVICTNGYTPNPFHQAIDKRFLPVQTSVIVTTPMSSEQIKQSNFISNEVMMDTRQLKYYYRKLADNRILFGGRGAITGKQAQDPIYHVRLLQGLKQAFPSLHQLEIDYRWSGWISVSLDDIPHIYQADNQVFYASGYCGAGLSFSSQAGKRLAQQVSGDKISDSPFLSTPLATTPLPKFPFSPFRRVGQAMFYQWGRIRDAIG